MVGSKLFVFNYRPQTNFAKVMFSQVFVCPQVGGPLSRWGSLSRRWSLSRGCLCPGESLSRGVSVQGVSVQGHLCSGGSLSRGSLSERPPPIRLRVGGTQPTEMHSCFKKCFIPFSPRWLTGALKMLF